MGLSTGGRFGQQGVKVCIKGQMAIYWKAVCSLHSMKMTKKDR